MAISSVFSSVFNLRCRAITLMSLPPSLFFMLCDFDLLKHNNIVHVLVYELANILGILRVNTVFTILHLTYTLGIVVVS